MPAIRTAQGTLELAGKSQLALERNSPLLAPLDERGNTSLPFKFPRTPTNGRLLGYPGRFDHHAGLPPQTLDAEALDDKGNEVASGLLRFRGVEADGYVYNLEFGASAVMDKLKAKRLPEFRMGGAFAMEHGQRPAGEELNDNRAISLFMAHVVNNWEAYPFTFAPFSNDDCVGQWDSLTDAAHQFDGEPTHSVTFNVWSSLFIPDATQGMGFGMPLSVQIPGAWNNPPLNPVIGACPLPKLEFVVRKIFEELALPLETDVFEDAALQRAVLVPANANFTYTMVESASGVSYRPACSVANHLPDLTAAEFIRKLMDSFGWHFDTTNTGTCRLLRTAPLVLTGESVDITPLLGRTMTLELTEPSSIVATPLLAEADRYSEEFGTQPEPEQLAPPVATVADLVTPTVADVYRLVRSERRYYQSVATNTSTTDPNTGTTTSTTTLSWEPGPFWLPNEQVGTADNTEDYPVGIATVLTQKINVATGAGYSPVETLCFLEPSYGHGNTALPRSSTLRLAFYYGLVPIGAGILDPNGQPAVIPWLSQRNEAPDGTLLSDYSLEVHGPSGLVRRFLRPLLAMKSGKRVAKYALVATAQQFKKLDFGKLVAVNGDEFLIQRASIAVPLRGAGLIELVPRGDLQNITSRTVPEQPVDAAAETPHLVCTLGYVATVTRNGNTAQIGHTGTAQGALKYQLNDGALQDSNLFTGLVTGTQYTFWVYDLGVTGCHQSVSMRW